jgi:hypothetical protein
MTDDKPNVRVVKTRLKNIIKDGNILNDINTAVITVNNIVIHIYQFIKLYFLYLYDHNLKFPIIDLKFIHYIGRTVSNKGSSRGKTKPATKKKLDELKTFYNEHYLPTFNKDLIPSSYKLRNILQYEETDILKNINNMISLTYFDKIKKLVKLLFYDKDDKKKTRHIYNYLIDINDVEMKNLDSYEECHNWIRNNKYKIIPEKNHYNKDNIYYDIKANPNDYLSNIFYVCRYIEKISLTTECTFVDCKDNCKHTYKHKIYSPLPLRTNLKPKYITLDTIGIVNKLLKNGSKYQKNINKNKDRIWNIILHLNKKIFRKRRYRFDYMIKTDGIGCSINFFPKNIEKINKSNAYRHLAHARLVSTRWLDLKSSERSEPSVSEMSLAYSNKYTKGKKKTKKKKRSELYLNEVKIDDSIQNKNIVGIDVGKNNLLYCVDKKSINGNQKNILRYTRKQRGYELQNKKYNRHINQLKKENVIIKNIESLLSSMSNKTSYFENYKWCITERNKYLPELLKFYEQERVRVYKWFKYINTQRSEQQFIKRFKQKFGNPKNTIIAIGDYGQKHQMPFIEPTKGIGFRSMFRRYGYKVYLIDEYNTSKKCHWCNDSITKKFMKTMVVNKYGKKEILLNSLLRCTNEKCIEGYKNRIFNRDLNGALNILEIAKTFIEDEYRPFKFCRGEN